MKSLEVALSAAKGISRKRSDIFANTMNESELLDMGFNGPKFTWTNRRKLNPILERLDRGWGNAQ